MNTSIVRDQLLANLKDGKEYREAFVAEHIKTTIPFQLRAIRKKLGWTQKKLGLKAGMASERITVLEDPNYAKFNLSTLLRLADAFDVALIVRFAPFNELLNWASRLSSDDIAVASFAEDKEIHAPAAAKQTISEQDESILELFGAKKHEKLKQDDSATNPSLFTGASSKEIAGNGLLHKIDHSKTTQLRLAVGGR